MKQISVGQMPVKNIHKELENKEQTIKCRDEIIEILKRENAELAKENQMLINKVLELEYKK